MPERGPGATHRVPDEPLESIDWAAYAVASVPNATDQHLARHVRAMAEVARRRGFVKRLSEAQSDTLWLFARRMACLAVRWQSPAPLALGLRAAAFAARGPDFWYSAGQLAPLIDAALRLPFGTGSTFREAARLGDGPFPGYILLRQPLPWAPLRRLQRLLLSPLGDRWRVEGEGERFRYVEAETGVDGVDFAIRLTRGLMRGLARSLECFRRDVGRYPTTSESLQALVTAPVEIRARWRGRYVPLVTKDAWGREFVYTSPASVAGRPFDLYSLGPDGESGDEGGRLYYQDEQLQNP